MGPSAPQHLVLAHEVSSVITAMRYNARWAILPAYYEEERNESSKYDETFRALRAEIYLLSDWANVNPMRYLAPFLALIKAQDVSGPITGTAAVALKHILESELITPLTVNAEAAINQLVDDTTQCKFESTSSAQDETVLLNIVQVLVRATECQSSMLLSDETYCKAFQAAFMLGDPVSKPKEYSDIMCYYSRQACGRLVNTLFTRLRLRAPETAAQQREGGATEAQRRSVSAAGAGGQPTTTTGAYMGHAQGHSHFFFSDPQGPSATHRAQAEVPLCSHGPKAALEIMDFLIELLRKEVDVDQEREQVEEMMVFALDMIHTALLAAGPELAQFDMLVAQVHVELVHALCQAVVVRPSISVITGTCQVISCIYNCLGTISIGQLELVLQKVLLKLAEGKGVTTLEQQEVALEGLLDLVRTPGFVHDIYVNCDCRLERSNLFEDLCGLLSRTAYPAAKGALGSLHLVSLDALTAILQAIASEARPNALQPPPPDLELPCFVDIWTPLSIGEHPDLTPLMGDQDTLTAQPQPNGQGAPASHPHSATGVGAVISAADLLAAERAFNAAAATAPTGQGVAGAHGKSSGDLMRLRGAVYEKHLKLKVKLGVDHFNKNHKKGFQFLQGQRLMPLLAGSPAAEAALAASPRPDLVARGIMSEDDLAMCLGRFLHSCPGLDKVAIGELLGEPDAFYLKVLDSYTASFDFSTLKFDAAIRLFLESFRLPGEAQKIDRVIASFGKYYYSMNQGVFKSSDAAYVLAYSVIMLNTDRHNSQVKVKMSLEAFRRNLRGVNENSDFPEDFLNAIFYGIVKTALRMSESTSMDVSEQQLVELHQLSRAARGRMVHADPGRHLVDVSMFRLLWGPAVHALCAITDNVTHETVVEAALAGLQLCTTIAAQHALDDVSDAVVAALAKIPMQVTHIQQSAVSNSTGGSLRPDVVFGRDVRMRAVTRAIATITNRHGDSLGSGWLQVMELVVVLYRQGILPETFTRALQGDGEGGLGVRAGEAMSLRVRRAHAARVAAVAASNISMFRSFTSIWGGGVSTAPALDVAALLASDPYAEGGPNRGPLNESDRTAAQAGEEVMTRCAFEDIFLDSKFLKQESLVHLVRAVIQASGPIPRPGLISQVQVAGSQAYAAGGAGPSGGWDTSELALELLFGILLRNRDRIAALWPPVYEHLQAIFTHSRDVDPVLVQKAIMAVMRLCLRLLPYKPHISESLVRGVQLVSLVDEQVAADMAPTIAAELLGLLKGAAPYLETQQVWVALTGLLKIIQYDPLSFPACVEAVAWVVGEALTPLNFPLVLHALVDLLERAADHATKGTSLTTASSALLSLPGGNSPETRGAPRAASAPILPALLAPQVLSPQGPGDAGGSDGGSSVPSSPGLVATGDPAIAALLQLLKQSEEWLETWWATTGKAGAAPQAANPGLGGGDAVAAFKQDAWGHVMSSLCRAIKNNNLQVRVGALECLQRAVVAAEKFAVPPSVVQRVLLQLLLPMTSDMCRVVASGSSRETPQADFTVRELVRALAKVVLLYAPLMGNNGPGTVGAAAPLMVGSSWGPAWRALLDCLVQGMAQAAPRSEMVAEALPEALKNMVLMLHAKGALREGWRDASDGSDLADLTWRAARKVSANLTPAILKLHVGV